MNVNASIVSEDEQNRALQVMCLFCDAAPGKRCVQPGRNTPLIGAFHPHRIELANRLIPHLQDIPKNLNSSQIALIVYYAFIALADSVAANSVKMVGKEQTSEEIQRCFARIAVKELKTAKLLD